MAAGLGFKDFTTGEVLTAADVDGYLMQGVWVFASATARDAAVTSPQEGNFAYLKDTNVTTYYTGSAWANIDTTGMTNPMTTTGDTIYSSSGSTPARLGIGTAGQVLQVNSGATAPEWATPASGGGMTLLNSGGTTLTGSATTVSFTSTGYTNLQVQVKNGSLAANANGFHLRLNTDTAANYSSMRYMNYNSGTSLDSNSSGDTEIIIGNRLGNVSTYYQTGNAAINIYRPTDTDFTFITWDASGFNSTLTNPWYVKGTGFYNCSAAISSITITADSSTWNAGTIYVYGVK